MTASMSVFALRRALRVCIDRLEIDPRAYWFYALDDDASHAWFEA